MKIQPINYIREKLTSKYKRYYSFTLLLLLLWPDIHGQITDKWTEIHLVDTMEYTVFGTEYIPDFRYPPSQLFDAGFSTCWVSHMINDSAYPSIFVALPKMAPKNITLNVFSGYGKSESLYFKNSRPREIQISLHTALVPDGYVSEYGLLCKAFQSPQHETVILKDTFGIQSINLHNIYEDFKSCHQEVLTGYKTHFDFPLFDTLILVKIKILSVYPGTAYDDICISEVFFSDCYISAAGSKAIDPSIGNVYVNEDENTLLVDTEKQKAVAVYNEQESILQIADITNDNRWAILISMPLETQGRIETQYRIIDIMNKEEISNKMECLIPDYIAGEPVYFEQMCGKIYLILERLSDGLIRIELRHFKQN